MTLAIRSRIGVITSLFLFILFSSNISLSQNNALSFKTGTSNWVEISDISGFTPESFSFECWMYFDGFSGYRTIFHIGNDTHSDFEIYTQSGDRIAHVPNRSNGGPSGSFVNYHVIPTNQWFLYTMTYSQANGLRIYFDGVITGTGNWVALPVISPNVKMYIGYQPSNSWGWCCPPAKMDEVRIWNTELSQAEIQNNIDCEMQGVEDDLFAYYSLNQGVADADNTGLTTVTDNSGNGHDGELVNFDLIGTTSNWVAGSTGITNTCAVTIGCSDPAACNYDSAVTFDDGSCTYPDGCTDSNSCDYDPAATCDDGSCTFSPGMNCDDGDPCTIGDTIDVNCNCVGTPKDCDDGNVCTDDVCDPSTGGCFNNALPTGTPCDDGDPTTINVCDAGSCTIVAFDMDQDGYDSTIDCDDNNPNIHPGAEDICDGLDNDCDGEYDEDAVPEDDGDPCTIDLCQSGIEVHIPMTCNDGIACTYDACVDGICVFTPDDSLCNDGVFCNGQETCDPVSGCTSGTPPNMDDGDPCTMDYCDEATQSIVHVPMTCDDGIDCTYDYCDNGTCVFMPDDSLCDDGNPCTVSTCDPVSGCSISPVPTGTPCDDGDPTTINVCDAGSCITVAFDMDQDGYDSSIDCNDNDPNVHPNAPEICNDLDDDCDGDIDEGLSSDADGDGHTAIGSCYGTADDCDDNNPSVYLSSPEICDGLDNDCDGDIDEGLSFDADGDGHTSIGSCYGTADDCDDNNPNIYLNAPEICDGLDNDCDGEIDEGISFDADGDGHTAIGSCSGTADDCDDNNPNVYLNAPEICDGLDNDCDGDVDEAIDVDSDGDVITDCDEVLIYFTDPYDADSDDDGLTDGLEINQSGTNPLLADTDGDGCTDDLEFSLACPDSVINDCPSDLDGDGTVNTADLLVFLGTFGQVCP